MTATAADFGRIFGRFTMRTAILAVLPSRTAAIFVSALLIALHFTSPVNPISPVKLRLLRFKTNRGCRQRQSSRQSPRTSTRTAILSNWRGAAGRPSADQSRLRLTQLLQSTRYLVRPFASRFPSPVWSNQNYLNGRRAVCRRPLRGLHIS